MTKVAICGGSGYTGAELIRLLSSHPHVELVAITSERSEGERVDQLFPHLKGICDLKFVSLKKNKLEEQAELLFLALPHGASQDRVEYFVKAGKRVIDLSADYRLRDPEVYRFWYGLEHNYPKTLKKAVYGLPELYRTKIKRAQLVANPGCYPTSALLGLYPALKAGIINTEGIVIDSKSGTSGAGRKADVAYNFCEINESFRAYGIATHRHTPEIEQELSKIAKTEITVDFTPHLLPINRGILTTIYAPLNNKDITEDEILRIYRKHYRGEPFVRIFEETLPDVRNVRGTNYCDIGVRINKRTSTLIVVSAIDNLLKGASGQAVQNMNLMLGLDETTGLTQIAALP